MKKNTPYIISFFITSLILATGLFYFNAETTCTYNIRGNLKVKTQLGEEISYNYTDTINPLENVKVRVKAKSCEYCPWSNWGEVQTDENGYFNISKQKTGNSCTNGRYIKVDAKFKSSKMEIQRGGLIDEWGVGADWYRVGERTNSQCKGTSPCNFGNLVFKASGSYDRSNEKARKHADIWFYYTWALKEMNNLGLPINRSNDDSLQVIYPLNRFLVGDAEASYVSPGSKRIHIFADGTRDHFKLETIWHELAHVWAFRYSTGEEVMRNYLLTHLSTHGIVKKPEVAFHEGFAEWFMLMLKSRFRKQHGLSMWQPYLYTKHYLYEQHRLRSNTANCEHSTREKNRVNDIGRLECLDLGWENILTAITFDDRADPDESQYDDQIFLVDLYQNTNCNSYELEACPTNYNTSIFYIDNLACPEFPIKLTFTQLLESIKDKDASDFNLNSFMGIIKNDFNIDNNDINVFKNTMDPTNEDSFNNIYCQKRIAIENFKLSQNSYFQYNWSLNGNYYIKDYPVTFKVINKGYEAAPQLTFLLNQLQNIDISTASEYYGAQIQIPINSSYSFNPGYADPIEQVLKIPVASNGSLPRTRIIWKTKIEQAIKSGGSYSMINHPDWQADTYTEYFGSDLSTHGIVLPESELVNVYQNNANQMGFTKAIPKSGGSSFTGNIIDTHYFLNNSETNRIEYYLEDPPARPGVEYESYVGACGIENIGNTPPFYQARLDITIGNKNLQPVYINNLLPLRGYIHLFRIFVDKKIKLRTDNQLFLKCLVDPPLDNNPNGSITELSEENNQYSGQFYPPESLYHLERINIFEILSESSLLDLLMNSATYDNPVDGLRIVRETTEEIFEAAKSYELKNDLANKPKLTRKFLTKAYERKYKTQQMKTKINDRILEKLELRQGK